MCVSVPHVPQDVSPQVDAAVAHQLTQRNQGLRVPHLPQETGQPRQSRPPPAVGPT